MKRKIGILNFQSAFNYGGMLQAYALQQKLIKLGYDCENIDYRQVGVVRNPNISNFCLKYPITYIRSKLRYYLLPQKRANAYNSFKKVYLKLSEQHFEREHNLEVLNSLYSTFIVGSDQVWNTKLTSDDPAYFLSFVNENKRKIAYAASFGQINRKSDSLYKHIKLFDFVSVRELASHYFLQEWLKCKSEITLDPVFFLNQENWNAIAEEPFIIEDYLLCYIMQNDPYIDKLCLALGKRHKLKVVKIANISSLMIRERFKKMKLIFNAGPLEFLGWMKNAKMVVTSSFHGTAFSIIYEKQFFSVLNNKSNNLNSRQKSILSLLNLEDRMLVVGEEYQSKLSMKIDYESVNRLLLQEKLNSIRFLKESIE